MAILLTSNAALVDLVRCCSTEESCSHKAIRHGAWFIIDNTGLYNATQGYRVMSKRKLGGFGLGAPPRIDGCDHSVWTRTNDGQSTSGSNASRGCSSNHSALCSKLGGRARSDATDSSERLKPSCTCPFVRWHGRCTRLHTDKSHSTQAMTALDQLQILHVTASSRSGFC